MAQPTLTTLNQGYRNNGEGQLFLAAYPATFGADRTARETTLAALWLDTNRKSLKAGITPWGTINDGGLEFEAKPGEVKFPYNNLPTVRRMTGIEEATLKFTIYDLDPNHWADIWGSDAADIVNTAASAGKAGRQSIILGTPQQKLVSVMFRVPSALVPGEFDHRFWTRATFTAKPKLVMARNKPQQLEVELSIEGDYNFPDAAGTPGFMLEDIAKTPGL